jgi:hypothetical protein
LDNKNFNERFDTFTFRRTEDMFKELYKDTEFLSLFKDYDNICDQVRELIPGELFNKLEEATSAFEGFEYDKIYKQGLSDGIKLAKTLNI